MSTVLEGAEKTDPDLDRTAFNLSVWKKLLADPQLAALPYRIETDRHGQMIMSPPPAPDHGSKQSEITRLLGNWNQSGKVLTECPISTTRGVKVVDVAWCSFDVWEGTEHKVCFVTSPEICVEVLSPSNTTSEIDEKRRLYFEAGAREVWICTKEGTMHFFNHDSPETAETHSRICQTFPAQID